MRYYWLFFGLFFFGCHEQNKNKISTAELMKSREIRKVDEAQILEGGNRLGEKILSSINQIIASKSIAETADCNLGAWEELDSLRENYGAIIRLVNSREENLSDLEFQLLEAYQYNLENEIAPTPSVQKMNSKTVLYVYPLDRKGNVFKYCMDSSRKATAQVWSLKIPIKAIVNNL